MKILTMTNNESFVVYLFICLIIAGGSGLGPKARPPAYIRVRTTWPYYFTGGAGLARPILTTLVK